MADSKGWAGKILRVNLSTGKISTEDTMKYKDYIGGMGIGYKVLFDEVPSGTKAYDEANKIIFAVGPLTGSGAVCAGRTNITTCSPLNPYSAVADSHFGGYWGSELKYAGWDAVIVEGKASYPVWIKIEDDKVSIENARRLWGKGTFDTQAEIGTLMGKEAHVACIGPAGENLVPTSFIRTGESHHAGGHGGVLGAKNLKAIGVRGTHSVRIAGTSAEWNKIVRENLAVIGSNNQHVVPNSPQPWSEYTNPATRWTAAKGRFWGAANPPVETGECDPHDINSIGYRCLKSLLDLGPLAEKYTVRMGGCASCPIRCHSQMKIPALEQFGYSPYVASTCVGFFSPGSIMLKGSNDIVEKGDGTLMARALGAQITNDLGIWCNYSQLPKDFAYAYKKGVLKRVLPAEEYKDIRFDLLEAKDIRFLIDFYERIAYQKGEFCHIADGISAVSKRWEFGEDYFNEKTYTVWSKAMGYPKHHSNEGGCAQTGALISMVKNRDAQNHSHMNFINAGLPVPKLNEIGAEIWGPSAIDEPMNYTPINPAKVKFAKWSLIKLALHDSLTLCNWMWPMTVSPLKERNYRGNLGLEAEYYSVATGIKKTEAELDFDAERVLHLHRALTVLQMGTADMRKEHDALPEWVFNEDPDKPAFTKGTDKLDREDMEKAMDMFYQELGWDVKTGSPTKATLVKFGLTDVVAELEKRNLLIG